MSTSRAFGPQKPRPGCSNVALDARRWRRNAHELAGDAALLPIDDVIEAGVAVVARLLERQRRVLFSDQRVKRIARLGDVQAECVRRGIAAVVTSWRPGARPVTAFERMSDCDVEDDEEMEAD